MRQSSRLKDSETSLKLKDEQFISAVATEDDEEYVEESEFVEEVLDYEEKLPVSPKKLKKRGRPRKSAPKPENVESEVSQEVITEDLNSNYIRKRGRPRKNAPKPETTEISQVIAKPIKSPKKSTTTKKKINRNGPYVPPLELIIENLLSSREEWKTFFDEENPKIKRRNRKYKTVMFPSNENFKVDIAEMSPFRVADRKSVKRALELSLKNNIVSLLDDPFIIEGKFANFNVGAAIISINFCKCISCKRGTDKILMYSVSSERISIISVELSKKEGIKSMKEVGQILPPEAEIFKTVCVAESILSASTENSIYFLNCETLHQERIDIILEKGPQIISESPNLISCHSWKGKYIAVGTISGRVHVFNIFLKEIYQISVKSDSKICSLDWRDDFTILIGGSFPKIFSIDLRDPFIIETEVSTLGNNRIISCICGLLILL